MTTIADMFRDEGEPAVLRRRFGEPPEPVLVRLDRADRALFASSLDEAFAGLSS